MSEANKAMWEELFGEEPPITRLRYVKRSRLRPEYGVDVSDQVEVLQYRQNGEWKDIVTKENENDQY